MNRNDTANVIEQERQAAPGPVRRRLWPFLLAAVLFHAAIVAALVHWTSSDRVQTVLMVDLIAGDSSDTASAQSAGRVPDETSDAQTKHTDLQMDELPPGSDQAVDSMSKEDSNSNLVQSSEQNTSRQTGAAAPAPERPQFGETGGGGEPLSSEPMPLQPLEQAASMDMNHDSPSLPASDQTPPAVLAAVPSGVATAATTVTSAAPSAAPPPASVLEANADSLSRAGRVEPSEHRDTSLDHLPPVSPKSEGRMADIAHPVAPKTSADSAAGSQARLPANAHPGEGPENQAQAAGLTQAAVGLHNPPPVYPARAKRQGVQGTVLLRLLISASGLVQKVDVVSSSRHRALDDAAIDAVALWRFKPAVELGVAIDQWIEVPVVFRLK